MKKISFYEAPTIETIDCAVEQGFAATGENKPGEVNKAGGMLDYNDYTSYDF